MTESYWRELREHARPLTAATLGVAFGMSIQTYTAGLFGAHLVKEFGWSRGDFALIGTFAIVMVAVLPLVGWITDRMGVRFSGAIGVFGLPLTFVALSRMSGSITEFFAINCVQLLISCFVTSVVFNRVVAERLFKARGLGFAIVMSGPPLAGGIAAWLLGPVIAEHGWRAGYLLLGAICFGFGLLALALLPKSHASTRAKTHLRADFAKVSHSKVFWLLAAGMVLVNLPQAVGASQQMLMLQEQGIALSATAYLMLYPLGVVLGRFATGLALDRFSAHRVAAFGLALPGLGLALLASPWDDGAVIAFALLLLGLAQGAEGDVAAFIVGQRFPLPVFASTVGLIGGATALGTSGGSWLFKLLLDQWGNFTPFLAISAVVTVIGAGLVLAIGPLNKEGSL